MNRRIQTTVMILLTMIVLILSWTVYSEARIIIVPPPHPPIPAPNQTITVSAYAVEVEIAQQVAHVNVRQTFMNETNREQEGEFLFPLPVDAQVSEFTLIADGRRLEGEILDKDRARQIYESIVRQRRDPALLEYIDSKLFRARVYPIPPNAKRTLEFSYDHILKADQGLVEFYFPLGHETQEMQLDRLDFNIDLKSDIPLKTIYSPTYDIDLDRIDAHHSRIELTESAGRFDQDFILYYSLSPKEMDLTLLTHRRSGEDGYFLAIVTPDPDMGANKYLAKDFIFVLDTSGSMKGEKIEQAQAALQYCLQSLDRRDQFNIITFEADVDVFYPRMTPATKDYIAEAKEFARTITARGGTNINDAMQEALRLARSTTRPTQIVFLTDGLPTVGEQDISAILKNTTTANRQEARIFVFGVGYDVNTHLLDLLAEQNHGTADYVRPGEDIEVKVSNLYEKISRPVLTDVEIDFGQRVYDLYPPRTPDLFAGTQLIVVGRYTGSGHKAIILTGKAAQDRHEWTYEANFPDRNWDNEFIPRLWASRKIGFLMDEIRLHGENQELVNEIVRLSEEFGIITPYTSFLVEEERTLSQWDEDRERIQNRAAQDVRSNLKRDEGASGEAAVEKSLSAKQFKESATYQQPPAVKSAPAQSEAQTGSSTSRPKGEQKTKSAIKQSGTRTYYLSDGVWVDNKHTATNKLIAIKPYSPAYFDLLKRYPALKSEFAVGEKVIVAFNGLSIKIEEKGLEKLSAADLSIIEVKIGAAGK